MLPRQLSNESTTPAPNQCSGFGVLSPSRSGALLTVVKEGVLSDELALMLTAQDRRVARMMASFSTIAERAAALHDAYELRADGMVRRPPCPS